MINPDSYRAAALRAADCVLAHQVPYSGSHWRGDANQGRFIFDLFENRAPDCSGTPSWGNSVHGMALLACHAATGEERYLASAAAAARYVKSLQVLDARQTAAFGVFREYTPLTAWVYPRDAVTCAWFLLGMHRVTAEADCLERADIFGRWLCTRALDADGWPFSYMALCDAYPAETTAPQFPGKIQCQIGVLPFLVWLHRLTGTGLYRDTAARIFKLVLERFQHEDGRYHGELEHAGLAQHGSDRPSNDDFGSIGMMACEVGLGLEGGIASARRFADAMVRDLQRYDTPAHTSAAPVAINLFTQLDALSGTETYRPWAERAAQWLLARQAASDGSLLAGSFIENEIARPPTRLTRGRTNAYAIAALLRLAGVDHGLFSARCPE